MGSFVNGMRDGQGMMYSVPETISTEIGDFNARGGIREENSLIISQPNVFNCHQNSQRGSKIIPLDIGLNRTVITSLFLRFHAGDFLPAFALVVRGLRVAHVHLF